MSRRESRRLFSGRWLIDTSAIDQPLGRGRAERPALLLLPLPLLLLQGGHREAQVLRTKSSNRRVEDGSSPGISSRRRGLAMVCGINSSYNSFSRRYNPTARACIRTATARQPGVVRNRGTHLWGARGHHCLANVTSVSQTRTNLTCKETGKRMRSTSEFAVNLHPVPV